MPSIVVCFENLQKLSIKILNVENIIMRNTNPEGDDSCQICESLELN